MRDSELLIDHLEHFPAGGAAGVLPAGDLQQFDEGSSFRPMANHVPQRGSLYIIGAEPVKMWPPLPLSTFSVETLPLTQKHGI